MKNKPPHDNDEQMIRLAIACVAIHGLLSAGATDVTLQRTVEYAFGVADMAMAKMAEPKASP